jgi:hypothetical protein
MSPFGLAFRVSLVRFALTVLALGLAPVHAATYTVGTTGGCSHANLQTAVNTAQATPGADTIRINIETFTAQEVLINTAQELNIIGGFADCSASAPSGSSRAILDGTGGNGHAVMRIFVPTGGVVRLSRLIIRKGDNPASDHGGGVYYEGNGLLDIRNSALTLNNAGYGAGLYARGTGDTAKVVFGPDTLVFNNVARRSGGGVYVEGATFHMQDPGSAIFGNAALGEVVGGTVDGGYGGGLVVLAKNRSATAHIGAGLGSVGVIYNNEARFGGGVALVGHDRSDEGLNSILRVHSANAGQPASIRNNVASDLGGGIYLKSRHSIFVATAVTITAHADLWNAELKGNSAPAGAAIYSDGDDLRAEVSFNMRTNAPAGFACPANQFCGGLLDNVAQTPDGTPTDGAVIHMVREGSLFLGSGFVDQELLGGLTIEGNRGGRLIHAGDGQEVSLANILVSDNQVSRPLIHVEGGESNLSLADLTFVGNVIASGQPVLQLGDGDLELRRSVLWQPGSTSLTCSGCSKTFERVITSERTSLDGGNGTQVVVADPRFVDPDFGDYRLRAGSPAVDYVPAIGGDDRDTLGLARDVDLPIKLGAFGGVRDIGAFERQGLQPLVQNSDMNTDVRLWTPLNGATITHDATMNASGDTGSGALRVLKTNATRGVPVRYARQCIHLPGPGRYLLNGFGRTEPSGLFIGTLDSAELRWELSHDGGETCTSGTHAALGMLALSSAGWIRPANPAVIDVSPADWTAQSSLMVVLVITDNSVAPNAATASGWFDGITLEVAAPEGTVFRDGFE